MTDTALPEILYHSCDEGARHCNVNAFLVISGEESTPTASIFCSRESAAGVVSLVATASSSVKTIRPPHPPTRRRDRATMTHTGQIELGKMEVDGFAPLIATINGGLHTVAAVYSSLDDACAFVARWNAFEDGGAVTLAIEALRAVVLNAIYIAGLTEDGCSECGGHWYKSGSEAHVDGCTIICARAALAALTEEAGK